MTPQTLSINGQEYIVTVRPDSPLLWVLRDTLGLTGTKFSCGIGLCGACTVHVDGEATHSCTTPVSSLNGKKITTIEGLSHRRDHALQQAWIAENVPQCGYCQPGQIMRAAALLAHNPNPKDEVIDKVLAGNFCRCGTYQRIRQAIHVAAQNGMTGHAGSIMGQGDFAPISGFSSEAVRLLPLAGAIALAKVGDTSKISRRNFLKVSALAGAGLVIGVCLPGCQNLRQTTPEQPLSKTPPVDSTAIATEETLAGSTSLPVTTASPEPTDLSIQTPAPAKTPTPTTTAPSPTSTASIVIPDPTATPEATAWFEPNVFLKIDNNGVVTITVHRSEMGQGVRTSLAMIVAEELDANWDQVHVEQAPADSRYGSQDTHGSLSIIECYYPLRQAGALARTMLVAAAAERWNVGQETCHTENGAVIHSASNQYLGYGELIETAVAMPLPTSSEVVLKEPKDFRIIGKNFGNVDVPQMVDGSAVYGIDVWLPEMLYATVARCPVFDGSIASLNTSQAEGIEGVRYVLPISSGVAVVAESTWAALKGRQALEIDWNEGPNRSLSSTTIREWFEEQTATADGFNDSQAVEAVYGMPFLAHTTMSPMNCVAHVGDDFCEVWAPTQRPAVAKNRARAITGLPSEAISVHVPLLGGGFGRRREDDFVAEAVQISKAIGAPVKLIWTREDDIQHDFYHPLSYQRVRARADTPGRYQTLASQTLRGIPTAAWRSATNLTPAFIRECIIDELAYAIGTDPYTLRLESPTYAKLRPVLELAAGQSGWGSALPSGQGRGIAAHSTWDTSHVAEVVEVSVDEEGIVRVNRVVCAIDCGIVINPDNVKAQMEGGIVYGLSAALKGEITIKDGRVEQSNFHDYPMLRMDEMPLIEVHIIPSDREPKGAGEMSVPPIIPALLNAIFDATGKRIRRLPIQPGQIREV